jgi:SNF2 family DNA or RNA helicase
MSSTTKWTASPSSGLAWKPLAYMKRAMRWILQNPVCGLFLDPGLRKTSITLGAFSLLQKEGMVERMLVVAPVKVCFNVWPVEAKKWADFQHLRVAVLHGDGDGKTDKVLDNPDIDIFVINPEGLEWLLGKKVRRRKWGKEVTVIEPNLERFKRLNAQMFVLDESSKFKNTQTKRFKLLQPFLPKFSRRIILTGSPSPKNYLDLFAQVYIVDLGRALGSYITHYRSKYFDATGFGGFTWELKEGSEKLIQKAIKPYFLRMEAEDYIDMPVLVENDIFIDLPTDARQMYDEMEDDLIILLEGGESLTAPTAAAARTKCAQIANGAIYTNPEGLEKRGKYDFLEIHDGKLEALDTYLDELNGKPCIILYWFQHDLIRIQRHLAKRGKDWENLPNISDASPKKAKEIEDAWNRNEYVALLANPASAGHGLNMQGGNAFNLFWFTLPDDFDIYDQTNRRLRRSGNTNTHVIATRVIARKTVDVAKTFLLRKKGSNQKQFLDAMKSYRRKSK